jgi:hypothetical protein
MRIDFPRPAPAIEALGSRASMARDQPDFSSLTPEEVAILFGPTHGQPKPTEEDRRDSVRRRIIEAAEQEGLTLEDVFGPDYAGWTSASLQKR